MKSSDIVRSCSNVQAQKDAGGKLKEHTTSQAQGLGVAKSYKEVLLCSGPRGEQFQQLPTLVFKTRIEDSIWLKDCYVGQVRATEHVHGLQDRLRMNGFQGCSVRRMGGKLVLLSSTNPEELHGMDEQCRQRTEITSCWGQCVAVDEATRQKQRLDVARLLLSTTHPGVIADSLSIEVDGVPFKLRVTEELPGESLQFLYGEGHRQEGSSRGLMHWVSSE
ncbi:hypothetical protein Ancab_015021 [Ancistrocladus abbreviatus]